MDFSNLKELSKGLGFSSSMYNAESNESFSAYKIVDGVGIRISNHKTRLRTWLNNNKEEGVPSICISIVCKCGDDTLDNLKNDVFLPDNVDFVVTEYVYDFNTFTKDDIKILASNIISAFKNKSYPNNAMQNGQKPNAEYVMKKNSSFIDSIEEKIKKRGGQIINERTLHHYICTFEEFVTECNTCK